jgi:hypothetical protein
LKRNAVLKKNPLADRLSLASRTNCAKIPQLSSIASAPSLGVCAWKRSPLSHLVGEPSARAMQLRYDALFVKTRHVLMTSD